MLSCCHIVISKFLKAAIIKQKSVGKCQILSSRCLLANVKYYQADVCWQMSNTIGQILLLQSAFSHQSTEPLKGPVVAWSEKLKIVLLILPCDQKLPFDVDFKKIEKFF